MTFRALFISSLLLLSSHSALSAGPISSMSSQNNSTNTNNSNNPAARSDKNVMPNQNNGSNNYYPSNNMGNMNGQQINPQYYQPIYNNQPQSQPQNNDNLNYRSPLIATSNWDGWTLNLINLDNNNKPKDQTALDLAKEAIIKHKDLSISIFPDNLEENAGKVVRFVCEKSNIVLTQKFGAPDQLKGFALQMECNKQKYYFIVNPK